MFKPNIRVLNFKKFNANKSIVCGLDDSEPLIYTDRLDELPVLSEQYVKECTKRALEKILIKGEVKILHVSRRGEKCVFCEFFDDNGKLIQGWYNNCPGNMPFLDYINDLDDSKDLFIFFVAYLLSFGDVWNQKTFNFNKTKSHKFPAKIDEISSFIVDKVVKGLYELPVKVSECCDSLAPEFIRSAFSSHIFEIPVYLTSACDAYCTITPSDFEILKSETK